MTTVNQNRDFAQDVMNADTMLEVVIDWIERNLNPEDVFGTRALQAWAGRNGFIKEL